MHDQKTTGPAQTVTSAQYIAATGLLQAYFAITSGDNDEARQTLKQALALCKNERHGCFELIHPEIISKLLLWSYEQGIEPKFTQHCMQSLQPGVNTVRQDTTQDAIPIKIYCLGRFTIRIDNQVVVNNKLGRNKPLELLKLLIALGGRQVSQERLSEILWPDTLGDSALRNFNTTLHRLRKLLGHNQAVVLKDTLLTIDTHYVQVDLWDVERLLSQLEQQLRYSQVDEPQLRALSENLFSLFHGDFLGNEPDRSWALLVRERLRNRMLKSLQALGKYWQAHDHNELAREIFERGLSLDPLNEVFYQYLMQLHIAKGHLSHAAAIYEKCRKVLATSLGVMPSSRTLSLYRQTQPL